MKNVFNTQPGSSPGYNIVMSEATLAGILQYKADIASGKASPGARLKAALDGEKAPEQFIEALLSTKQPKIFAESEIRGDGSDWTHRELALLGDINVTMAVKIFDNGAWSPSDKHFREHAVPLEGHLLFTPGPLLGVGAAFSGTSPDFAEVVSGGKIDQAKYNALIERRLLPILAEANDCAAKDGTPALITLPGIGCGAFAGSFKGQMGAHLDTALRAMLEKHAPSLPHIAGVYFDPFGECGNAQKDFGGIKYLVRPATLNPGKPQLCAPETYGADFADCRLYKIVAWDHASLPGNDFFGDSRFTDDGVSAAATNSMEVVTGTRGHYSGGSYAPPAGYKDWEDVAEKNNVRLQAAGNVKIVTADAACLDLQSYLNMAAPARKTAPRP
ncbi:MAG: hypothetical protein ACAH80_03360 [Alphaproteobacteria bacterium]